MREEDNKNIIICPKCKGEGRKNLVLKCPHCLGVGFGVFFENRFLYCDLEISRDHIKIREKKIQIYKAVDIISYLIGISGIFLLFYWINSVQNIYGASALFFWQFKDPLILCFFLSSFFDMFIVYRLTQKKLGQKKIHNFDLLENRKFKKKKQKIKIPKNWEGLKDYPYKINITQGLGMDVINIIEKSFFSVDIKNGYKNSRYGKVSILHLFLALLEDKKVFAILFRLNIDWKGIILKINRQILKMQGMTDWKELDPKERARKDKDRIDKPIKLNIALKEILIESYMRAYKLNQEKIKPFNLIYPSYKKSEILAEILYDSEIDKEKIKNVVEWFIINEELEKNQKRYKKLALFKPKTNMDRAYTAVATPILNQFSYDITLAAKMGKLDICIGREKEIKGILESIEAGNNGVLLSGAVGVGKKSIIYGIARMMVAEEVPGFLQDKRLLELDIARLVGGVNVSEAESRILSVITEITKAKNIVIFIDNIENIIGLSSGQESSLELSEILADALERRLFFCLGAVTNRNYIKYIEGKPLGNSFSRIKIDEPDTNKSIQIVESKIKKLELRYGIFFSYPAIEQAVKLTTRYIHDNYLPQKAIKILERTAARVSKNNFNNSAAYMCNANDIAITINEITDIPTQKINENETKVLLELENEFHKRMIGQEEAVKMVANSLRRARINLRSAKRPIASFLFLGPTGVGKTELAKTVSQVYFSSEQYMIRLDMSEYQHKDSVKKVIGDADGTLGYLTEAVRKKPFALVLLDEIEKAHGDILNLFLQVMDDGRLTDGQGRTIDFTNTIIITTSNIGSIYIQKEVAQGTDLAFIKKELIRNHINQVMRPELVNRFDGVVVFKPLTMGNVQDIAKLMIKNLASLLDTKGMILKAGKEGIKELARLGYDPKFGARPLRRLLQDRIENEIAKKILSGELERRDTVFINGEANLEIIKAKKL